MENFVNTAALVKTFTENIHLKTVKVKEVKTKDTMALLETEVRTVLAQEKLCMQVNVNLRGP